MSSYLIGQINGAGNIHLLPKTEIWEARGNSHLTELLLENVDTKEVVPKPADALYVFIGAKPFTDWIGTDIIRNGKGFIETGRDLKSYERFNQVWKLDRDPYLLETSLPGVFAAGDVRAGAMNRVASAVGEGSMAISFVHKYLADV
jgi:thioredoxin reductase (NADPH)